jgi:hypothetical protein
MKRKRLVGPLAAAGVILVAGGLVLMIAVVPPMKKLPGDTDITRSYTGIMKTMLDPATLTVSKDVPITITRHVKALATSGDLAEVSESVQMAAGGRTIQNLLSTYAVDRSTLAAVGKAGVPADWTRASGYWPRTGVVFSWPIGVAKKDLVGWSDDYRGVVPLKFAGVVKHPRSGLTTYHFTSISAAKPIVPEQVKLMGLPTDVPKSALGTLIGSADLGPMGAIVKQMLPNLIAALPGATVPLQYFYSYEADYWIEPTSGVMVDTTKHELRTVGLPDSAIKGTVLAQLPTSQRAAMRIPVSDFTYSQSDASVADAAKQARDAAGAIGLFGTTLPIILIVLGALSLVGSGVVVVLARR